MKAVRFLVPGRERGQGSTFCRWDTPEIREELRIAVALTRQSVTLTGYYKDDASALSARLADVLLERQWPFQAPAKGAMRLAGKLGLLEGYSCPRATLDSWSEIPLLGSIRA